jgi:hypothetical protein
MEDEVSADDKTTHTGPNVRPRSSHFGIGTQCVEGAIEIVLLIVALPCSPLLL